MMDPRWKQKLSKFSVLSGADQWLLLRAAAWLAIARMMLIAIPFQRLVKKLTAEDQAAIPEADPELLKRVGFAVAAAANNVPWRSDCFPQTIAARMLLKSKGFRSTIHIGVERLGDDILNGHAWLTCGETVVTGGGELHRYTELHFT
jgi:hypothetical protein